MLMLMHFWDTQIVIEYTSPSKDGGVWSRVREGANDINFVLREDSFGLATYGWSTVSSGQASLLARGVGTSYCSACCSICVAADCNAMLITRPNHRPACSGIPCLTAST